MKSIASGMFITTQRQRVAAFSRPTAQVGPALLVAPFNPQGLHRLQDLVARPDLKLAVLSGSVEQEAARQLGLHEPRLLVLQEAQHGLSAVQGRQADPSCCRGPPFAGLRAWAAMRSASWPIRSRFRCCMVNL